MSPGHGGQDIGIGRLAGAPRDVANELGGVLLRLVGSEPDRERCQRLGQRDEIGAPGLVGHLGDLAGKEAGLFADLLGKPAVFSPAAQECLHQSAKDDRVVGSGRGLAEPMRQGQGSSRLESLSQPGEGLQRAARQQRIGALARRLVTGRPR